MRESVICSLCGKELSTPRHRRDHEAKCNGAHSLQCPVCWEEFSTSKRKSRHCLAASCTARPKPGTQPDSPGGISLSNCNNNTINHSTTNIIDNSTNIDNSTTNNINVNVACSVNDFHRTKVGPTVNNLMRNPAPIQLANERKHDKLEETLAQATYWATPENRNVLGIESHGRNMFVQMRGKKGVIDRKEGIAHMIKTVRDIVRAPEIRDLLGPCIRLADIEDVKEFVALRPKYANVIENGGEFGNSILVPELRPYFVPESELRKLILAAAEQVSPDIHKLPVKPFRHAIMQVCMRFGYADGRWFVGSGGLVGEPSEAEVIKRLELTHLPYEYPEPKELHPSLVDRTKVGWQLVSDPHIDHYGVPTYFRYIVVEKMRDTMKEITQCDLSRDLVEGINKVNSDFLFLNDLTTIVLQKMKTYKSEGIPINWEEYAL